MDQTKFLLAPKHEDNFQHNHITINLKGNWKKLFPSLNKKFPFGPLESLAGKTATICRTDIRETGVSRYHGGKIKDPPETHRTSWHYCIEGFKGALRWVPNMLKDASLSNSWCIFFCSLAGNQGINEPRFRFLQRNWKLFISVRWLLSASLFNSWLGPLKFTEQ